MAARRQFFISAVIVATALSAVTVASFRGIGSPSHPTAETSRRVEFAAEAIKTHVTHVRYVDRSSSDHRISIASSAD